MAQRCENCGKVIVFSNIGIAHMIYGLCNDCDKSMGIFDKAIYLNNRESEKTKERSDTFVNDLQEWGERRQERERTFRSQLIWDSEQDRLEHQRLSKEDRVRCVNLQNNIIHLAALKGVEPHNFNYDNYCMLCGKHVEDIPESNPKCTPRKKK